MQKDTLISFRLSRELRESLQKMAHEERRSVSGVIETLLMQGLKGRKLLPLEDRRGFSRRDVLLPALIFNPATGETYCGTIKDISLTGLRISFSNGAAQMIQRDAEDGIVNINFPLPEEEIAVLVACKAERITGVNGNTEAGMSFVDCDFIYYQKLRNYLLVQ
jgi:hypothetical protein